MTARSRSSSTANNDVNRQSYLAIVGSVLDNRSPYTLPEGPGRIECHEVNYDLGSVIRQEIAGDAARRDDGRKSTAPDSRADQPDIPGHRGDYRGGHLRDDRAHRG